MNWAAYARKANRHFWACAEATLTGTQSSVITNIFIHTYITDISVFGTAKGYKKKKINKKRK